MSASRNDSLPARLLAPYRRLSAAPHLPSVLAWSLVGRLERTSTSLALTFLVAGWTGSYALAGVTVMALGAGQGVAGPWRGRIADRTSPSKVMVYTGVVYASGLGALAILPAKLFVLALPLAALTGLFAPPAGQTGRSSFARLAGGVAVQAAFGVEATLQELLYIVGPVLAAGVIAATNPAAGVLLCAAWALIGSLGLAHALRRAGICGPVARSDPPSPRTRSLLAAPAFPRMLLLFVCLIGGLMADDLVMTSWARQRGEPVLAGVFAGIWALGSLAGGLIMASATRPPRLGRRAAAAALGAIVLVPALPPVSAPGSPLLFGILLLVSGTTIAPIMAAANSRVNDLAPPGRRAEAFGWVSTAITAATSLSAPLAGALLDHGGPAVAAAAAGTMMALAAVLAGTVPATGRVEHTGAT